MKAAIATNALVGIACLAVGAAIGILYGRDATVPPPPADTTRPGSAIADGALATALRELTARIAQLERNVQQQPPATERQEVPPSSVAPAPPRDDLDAALARLTALAERLAGAQTDSSNEALRLARIQNPQLNLAAARLLHQQLQAESSLDLFHQSARREWSLLTMAEVIARLGTPTLVFPANKLPNDVMWEYHFDDDQLLVLHFRNGLVVAIDG